MDNFLIFIGVLLVGLVLLLVIAAVSWASVFELIAAHEALVTLLVLAAVLALVGFLGTR